MQRKNKVGRGTAQRFYPLGKLPMEKLDALLRTHSVPGKRVLVGAGIGKDAAVIDWGENCLVAKTDPITFVTDEIGYYAVNINANDVVCAGARPKWFLATLLLPEGATDEKMVDRIFSQISRACRDLDIGLVGGHTEITSGIDRPIVVGQMLGEVKKDRLVRPDRMAPGDLVLITKGIAIEAVSILAREKEEEVREAFGEEFVRRAREFLHDPGISVVRDALLAVEAGDVHAFHDPTEGGLATGLHELARAGSVGLEIDRSLLPVLPEAEKLCELFGLDPLGVIASGSLLIVAPAPDADDIAARLRQNGIACTVIGEVIPRDRGVLLLENGQTRPLPRFDRDEITRIFE